MPGKSSLRPERSWSNDRAGVSRIYSKLNVVPLAETDELSRELINVLSGA